MASCNADLSVTPALATNKVTSACSDIISVSVFAPKAELADALATSIFVMGKEIGVDRVNQIPKIECIIIDDQGNITKSKNIEIDKLW